MNNKKKLQDMIDDLDNMSTTYISNTNLYMKINTAIKIIRDIKSTVDFIEEKDINDKC